MTWIFVARLRLESECHIKDAEALTVCTYEALLHPLAIHERAHRYPLHDAVMSKYCRVSPSDKIQHKANADQQFSNSTINLFFVRQRSV